MTGLTISDGGLQLALVLNASMTFLILGLATDRFFRWPSSPIPWRVRVHRVVGMGVSTLHVLALAANSAPRPRAMALAFGLYFAGLALFFWAQETVKGRPPAVPFSAEVPETLEVTGAFGLVRHPFYVAYFLIWSAGAVGSGNPWVVLSTVWMALAYAVAAREEERAFENGRWRESYRLYAARTGPWVPNIQRFTGFAHPAGKVARVVPAAAAIAIVITIVVLLLPQ
jgi:protein-S-isoprenylcysteine O-methyltransferase Ste14